MYVYFFLHFVLGMFTNLSNSFSFYMMRKKVVPIMDYSHKTKSPKIIGIWRIASIENENTGHPLLTTLNKIPDCKCTSNMVYYYAYTLGRFCSTKYFWLNVSTIDIVYLPNQLYDVW